MPPLGVRQATVTTVQRWAAAGNLWAVVDATDTPEVLERVSRLGPGVAVSLYRGQPEEDLAAVAPYLMRVGAETFQWITETLWARPWGILVSAAGDLDSLRLHFRRLLTVESPEGEPWYFRFYDPRVLPPFLEASTEAERDLVFGPVRAFGIADPETYGVRLLTRDAAAPTRGPEVRVRLGAGPG